MTRIYANRGLARRMNFSVVIIAGAVLFGCWELWSAYRGGSDGMNFIFALFFLGGAAYAWKFIREGASNAVTWLDADLETRQSRAALWRPFSSKEIAGPLENFTDWQLQKRAGRVPVPMLTAHHPDYGHPLEFELGPGIVIDDAFRALAPDVMAAFEKRGAPA
jgi:hypothetical protein